MKKTLVSIHVMPSELEMFERFMVQYRKALHHLNSQEDDVTLKVSLNLNPELTDWENSELKQDFFVNRFATMFNGIKNINEIILDTSLWGTTQQKRETIGLLYDQYIFCDADIMLHEYQLKTQLNVSYQLDGMYIVSPSISRWWDPSWDILVHSDHKEKQLGSAHSQEVLDNSYTQPVKDLAAKRIPFIKFGCGMHTLYSKSFWDLMGIPESFGGYGPEDTFGMTCAQLAIQKGYDIKQYVLDGMYITEDYINRQSSYHEKIKPFDRKKEFYSKAESVAREEVLKFIQTI